MAGKHNDHTATLVQLRAWLARSDLPPNTRLPPERELSEILGVSRASLRKALAELESEGQLWRHVGKGTFTGTRVVEAINLAEIAHQTNPAEVMRARLLLEPLIAREAAIHSRPTGIEALKACAERSRAASTWRQYETADNDLHRTIALATGNRMVLAIFDVLNAVRRTVVWGHMRPNIDQPPADHHSFSAHDRIIAAIEMRDREGASAAMRDHLKNVERVLLGDDR